MSELEGVKVNKAKLKQLAMHQEILKKIAADAVELNHDAPGNIEED